MIRIGCFCNNLACVRETGPPSCNCGSSPVVIFIPNEPVILESKRCVGRCDEDTCRMQSIVDLSARDVNVRCRNNRGRQGWNRRCWPHIRRSTRESHIFHPHPRVGRPLLVTPEPSSLTSPSGTKPPAFPNMQALFHEDRHGTRHQLSRQSRRPLMKRKGRHSWWEPRHLSRSRSCRRDSTDPNSSGKVAPSAPTCDSRCLSSLLWSLS